MTARLVLAAAVALTACKGEPAAAPDDAAALGAATVAALSRLDDVDLSLPEGRAECAEYQVAAGEVLRAIDARLATLAGAPTAEAATTAGAWLEVRATALAAAEPPGTELPRLHRELTALLTDVAAALAAPAAAALPARLDNAADNLEVTLTALRTVCAGR